jgi:hypothetical protein
MRPLSRRELLRAFAAASGAGLSGSLLLDPKALAAGAADPRFLIVFCASGGGSIIDGPLAIRASESAHPDTINTFPDAQVVGFEGSPFRAVQLSGDRIGPIPSGFSVDPSEVLSRRRRDLMVSTWTRTSVNHNVGQKRSVTGNEAWRGRTLQELVAWQYGLDCPIPNVHLLAGVGYSEAGTDATVPPWARGQIVANPAIWPLSLDGSRGQPGALPPEVLAAVRKHRDGVFDPGTRFGQVFGGAPRVVQWKDLRGPSQARIEDLDLITRLMVRPSSPEFPLADYGLAEGPGSEAVRAVFPNYEKDPLQAQAALAFLLFKHRVSVSVTLGPSFDFIYDPGDSPDDYLADNSIINPPLAFDSSHQGHRSGQAVVWDRILRTIDGLITLLEGEDYGDGTSLWDRTMIYVASDFGREKTRPAGATDWGTSHHLNNGVMTFSPLVPGDTLLGGVDPDTGLTYGFDPATGAPEPGREMAEAEVFSGLLGALGVDTAGSGLPAVPAMRRS